MLDHVVELVWLLGMALFHRCNHIHHPAARLSSSQVSPRPKKDKLGDIPVVEPNTTPVWPSVFPYF